MTVASPEAMEQPLTASSSTTARPASKEFDVVEAYHRALNDDKVCLVTFQSQCMIITWSRTYHDYV
jgi:hypothetical protein